MAEIVNYRSVRRITLVRTAVTMVIFAAGGMAYFSRARPGHARVTSRAQPPFLTSLDSGHIRTSHSLSRRLLSTHHANGLNESAEDGNPISQSPFYRDDVDYESEFEENCTERGINSFPDGVFTNEQRLNGALVVNFAAAVYLCGVIGYVCSTYFVPSLEVLSERLNLQTDVAGATFMAAGSSAPELFASVIGIFISHDDTGLSAIVGSAAFNIFVIIALCCFFSGHVLHINWWPFVRDCVVYVISIILMVAFIYNSRVEWWEGLILTFGYVGYITIMYFNPYLSRRADDFSAKWRARRTKKVETAEDTVGLLGDSADCERSYGSVTAKPDNDAQPWVENGSIRNTQNSVLSNHQDRLEESDTEVNFENTTLERPRADTTMSNLSCSLPADHRPLSARGGSVFTLPDSLGFRILWIVGFPTVVLTFLTIPDCRKSGLWRRLYFISFLLATVWLAGASYLLYWMIVVIGYTLDVPDTVMGISFLAGGTSVPDAIASVLVARDGYGDMALSNIIGSNIFEVFVCLGMLWFIYGLAYSEPLEISSEGLTFTTISLLLTVAFILLAIHLNGWKLDLKMGWICLVVYLGFIALAIVWELGIIGDIDPPVYCQNPL